MTELQEYSFQLVYKPGNTQKNVDALSQRPDHAQGEEDNKNQTLLKEEVFRQLTTAEGEFWREIEKAEEFIEEEIKEVVER